MTDEKSFVIERVVGSAPTPDQNVVSGNYIISQEVALAISKLVLTQRSLGNKATRFDTYIALLKKGLESANPIVDITPTESASKVLMYIPEDVHAQIKERAQSAGLSLQAYVPGLIREALLKLRNL